MNVNELISWLKTFWEICSSICDETNIAEGVSLFVVPVMPKILACSPLDIKAIFQTLSYTDNKIGYEANST
jgi:hypothetical protein